MSTTDPKPTVSRTYISNVTLSIGMLSTLGNLHTTKQEKKDDIHLTCPTCAAPTEFLKQKYVCSDNAAHGPFASGEAARGQMVGDKLVRIDKTEVEEARKSVLPERELELQVHKREDVDKHTFPMGNAYVFTPTGNPAFASVLIEILKKRRDIALVAKTNLRKHDHIVMLDVELNDQLVLREMVWPENMKSFAPLGLDKASTKLVAQADMLIEASIEPFDPAEYRKDSTDRLAAVVDAAAGGGASAKKAPSKKKVNEADLSDMIEAAIRAKKAG